MSQRATVVEDFDDDTDLLLPSHLLQRAGAHGPILEEIATEEDISPSWGGYQSPGQASSAQFLRAQPTDNRKEVKDITPYKSWSCIYPIYIDAKRAYTNGERRLPRNKSVWWPLSKDIAEAASRLGLGVLHEVNKSHPRDWENPGRVRVQWKSDGILANPAIQTKKQLLELIAHHIQRNKPDSVPKPPYTWAPPKPTETQPPRKSAKGKQRATAPAKHPAAPPKPRGRRLPVPPDPRPPVADQLSAYSPALPSGVLVEAVKAGMNAQDGGNGAIPGAPVAGSSGAGKGKRRVVRVRA